MLVQVSSSKLLSFSQLMLGGKRGYVSESYDSEDSSWPYFASWNKNLYSSSRKVSDMAIRVAVSTEIL
ncbi:hypothetical protein K7X08_030228 [Anisodus acutangulus]|uniref:Uncharacterized protein n=1 Tax=Anisodus acutangulus TaxID=402998 RepID=A0A9Q1R4X3_9SOLA|nr:hypothetical protein K7X08_030228 [Anisodus acutangulus]